MFIRKKKYEDLLDKLDEVSRENVMLKRQILISEERKKSHEPSPACNGCKHLVVVDNNPLMRKEYLCKLDRGCQEYTEE